jgi:hypothetical protein
MSVFSSPSQSPIIDKSTYDALVANRDKVLLIKYKTSARVEHLITAVENNDIELVRILVQSVKYDVIMQDNSTMLTYLKRYIQSREEMFTFALINEKYKCCRILIDGYDISIGNLINLINKKNDDTDYLLRYIIKYQIDKFKPHHIIRLSKMGRTNIALTLIMNMDTKDFDIDRMNTMCNDEIKLCLAHKMNQFM